MKSAVYSRALRNLPPKTKTSTQTQASNKALQNKYYCEPAKVKAEMALVPPKQTIPQRLAFWRKQPKTDGP